MNEQRTAKGSTSSHVWEHLEEFVREYVQRFIQALLEEAVTELVGRQKSVRRAAVDAPAGYRNGHGKPRRLALMSGTITVRRPRVRGLMREMGLEAVYLKPRLSLPGERRPLYPYLLRNLAITRPKPSVGDGHYLPSTEAGGSLSDGRDGLVQPVCGELDGVGDDGGGLLRGGLGEGPPSSEP